MTSMRLLVWTLCLAMFLFVLTACTTTTKIVCPSLAPPTGAIVDALEKAGRQDPSSAVWVDRLEKHYAKLDACR